MNLQPVSVVIPTFNRAKLIVQSLDSVLAAIAEADEIIVVDDGSTDNTEEVLRPYGDRIRYVRVTNGGAGAARNTGARIAKHDLIAFCDSDDLWMPDRLVLGRQLLAARPDVLFCFSDIGLLDEHGAVSHYGLSGWLQESHAHGPVPWQKILGDGVSYSTLASLPVGREDFSVYFGDLYDVQLRGSYVPAITLLVRRGAAGDALYFSEDLRWGEDWECASRLARKGLAAVMDCETGIQRGHGGDRLTNFSLIQKGEYKLKLLSRIYGSDADYLARHQQDYDDAVRRARLKLSRALIVAGRGHEAREHLRLCSEKPWTYSMLAAMPAPLVRGVLDLRRDLIRIASFNRSS